MIFGKKILKRPSSLTQTMLSYSLRYTSSWRVLKVCLDVILEHAHCLSGLNFLLFSLGLHKHVDILEREKVTLKQQAEELQKKLDATEGRRATIEEKLTEGAITTVEHVVGVIKSR